ncbi:DUF4177 domain-containing protein [Clostridium sp. AL.422]|uniref:DUF4177 domain-containing protein n=1 Tax=Clostridium TaxID=1485 RepID=UPI00293DC216|nr:MULTISPECIES: DUF4177 domain-containing protein [unclassified Clostridium]MDV4150937.1 DUF4177 domain-containing protein [Clostridium sp. AL.422]
MYKYLFIECKVGGLFGKNNHQEIIAMNAAEGWRFVSAIPKSNGSYGQINIIDLVFEKYDEE